jgi:hypothetical protein
VRIWDTAPQSMRVQPLVDCRPPRGQVTRANRVSARVGDSRSRIHIDK